MPDAIVETTGLTHDYGEVIALSRVDLTIPSGTVGLVGANGAGKTTLLRILLGMIHATSGDVTVLGKNVRTEPGTVRGVIGYMPEGECLPNDQTAADFVRFTAEMAGLPPRDARRRASETLFLVGLHEERFRFLGDFSTGMRQRVKLAQAIVHSPELVLLDEPASGLDPDGRDQMLDLISRIGDFGLNVIFSTHILDDIEQTCEWVVMLDGGKLIRSAPIGDLGVEEGLFVEVHGSNEELKAALTAAGASLVPQGSGLTVRHSSADPYLIVRDALAETGTAVRRFGSSTLTLEELFISEAEGEK